MSKYIVRVSYAGDLLIHICAESEEDAAREAHMTIKEKGLKIDPDSAYYYSVEVSSA